MERLSIVSTAEAATILRAGGVALVPTETVVGLVAAEPGFRRLAEIKARDPEKPIAFLCASKEEAFGLTSGVSGVAEKLAERYWPGPLTLVLAADAGGTVGVRVPDHPVILALLSAAGGPLYATSANLSGTPPPASLAEVDPRVADAVDAAIEGDTGIGEASAVVDLSGAEPRLLRASSELTEKKLLRLAGELRENI
ncbi:MAG: L-threonylcarbamoyladenylate synthase [Rubrobacteraceae bacterium]